MGNKLNIDNCRKCGAANPPSNQYCAACGAVLQVSTAMMAAQPKAVAPHMHQFEKKWLFASIFVFLGVFVICVALFFVFATLFLDAVATDVAFGETALKTGLIKVMVFTLILVTVLYFAAGILVSRLAQDKKTLEAALGTMISSIAVGIGGSLFSSDFLLLSLVCGIPGAAIAALGARIGGRKYMRSM
ncbi:MAG: zinc ribbon domain-containing protein [Deltaproteobacteria bacterium]|nr:zinc ribbon domain-containing protein [Deltaproteobacteria bacterium]